ncbi:MAG: ribonuclease HIII [Akkermansiaceae bacterium]|nr:ribonuclease HIII [Akkermansiaceae bacterium]
MASQYTIDLNTADALELKRKLQVRAGYEPAQREYTEFCFNGPKVSVAYYAKRGKLVVQGSGADEFLEFVMLIDPKTGEFAVKKQAGAKVDKTPHFGVDESGKGDYFGPLVIAGVYSDERTAETLVKLGCKDSKAIPDDKKIAAIAAKIMNLPGIAYEVVCIGPKRYNELYSEFGNLNRLLAWGHARVIAALHEKVPSCTRALSDQFANEWVLKTALGKRHVPVQLEQRTKAESDVAVAAASILARARFVKWMIDTAAAAGCDMPLGCAGHVAKAARAFVAKHGQERLGDVAKLHFKTTQKVLQ